MPLSPKLIHKHDVVALGYRKLGAVGRECHGAHDVTLLALFGGLGWEFVLFFTVFVKQVDNPVGSRYRETHGVGAPRQGGDFLHSVDRFNQIAGISKSHF